MTRGVSGIQGTSGKRSKEPSDMVDQRGNEVQSDQMKANDRGIERTSGPCEDLFQKILPK